MSLPITLIPETLPGFCDVCRTESLLLTRFYIEAQDHSGCSPATCPSCQRKLVPMRADLDPPPTINGARPPTKKMRKAVNKQERQIAERIGGRKQCASGAMDGYKGDVRKVGELRGELKQTSKQSITLKRDVLDKIRSECVGKERPFVSIRFINPHTTATEDEWVLVPIEDWPHATDNNR